MQDRGLGRGLKTVKEIIKMVKGVTRNKFIYLSFFVMFSNTYLGRRSLLKSKGKVDQGIRKRVKERSKRPEKEALESARRMFRYLSLTAEFCHISLGRY